MFKTQNFKYCIDECPIGRIVKDHFLSKTESVFDAASDFDNFVCNCFKECIYREKHKNEKTTSL